MPCHDADDRPDPAMLRLYARMSPARRMAVVDNLVLSLRELSAAGVRAQHPDWNDAQVCREVARRTSSQAAAW